MTNTRGWLTRAGLAVFLGWFSFGCVTIDDLSTENYRKIGLPDRWIQNEPVGVLPMMGGTTVRGNLTMADEILHRSLRRQEGPWVDARESMNRIREAGLEDVYEDWARRYKFNRPPQQGPLEAIGKAIGTRHLLLTELHPAELTEGATQVRVLGRIWDSEEGEILWEATGESRGYVVLIFPWIPSSFEKTLAVACDGLVDRLP